MRDDHLPAKDHVARYIPGSKLNASGNPMGTAFLLRQGEEFLSVEWLECLSPKDRTEAVNKVVSILAKKLTLTRTSRLGLMNVGDTCRTVQRAAGRPIRILHQPNRSDPAHAGIFDTGEDEMIVAEILAESVAESCGVGDFLR